MAKYSSESLGVNIDVDDVKCEGVGDCVTACPADVYDLVKGKAVASRIDDCIECCACVDACPKAAITHSSC